MNSLSYSRDIILTPEEIIIHGRHIAKNHNTIQNIKSVPELIKKLKENYKTIISVYKEHNSEIEKGHDLSYSSQWLLDNFYKIEEQYQEVLLSLNDSKYMKLDILNSGYMKGYPRVYAIAYEFISHRDNIIDDKLFIDYVQSYQQERILKINELWALSLMLKCALIDDIKEICNLIHNDTIQFKRAEETLVQGEHIIEKVRRNLNEYSGVTSNYIEHLIMLMKRRGLDTGEVVKVIENKLQDYNISIPKVIEKQHREQAQRKTSIGNALTSLSKIASFNWEDIFEGISLVESVLNKDPSDTYQKMDFESKNYYRDAIVNISKKSNEPENKIARIAIELSNESRGNPKESHVGYYLIDKGKEKLMKSLGCQGKIKSNNNSLKVYLMPIFITVILIEIGIFMLFYDSANLPLTVILMMTLIIPISEISISLVNYIYSSYYKPTFLPRLELEEGITEENTTLVVIPALIPNQDVMLQLIAKIEVYYLANKEKNIFFSIAGDFIDSDQKDLKEDQFIIKSAQREIHKLNQKYGKDIFHYFHRERMYNKNAKRWMGWERKRGALIELNRLILGDLNTSYQYKYGDNDILKNIKYVLTIDSDTQLTLGMAKKFIGIISHPLHKPVIDYNRNKVVDGYGLIQSRIGIDLDSANKSSLTKVFGGLGGIDNYTIANSNIYQDMFGIGIFTGKGIYDLGTFQELLDCRFPENRILSHDLLEGSYLRTGLATDIELLDGFPSKYNSYIKRNHRWMRGDWQLLPWLKRYVLNTKGEKGKNPLSAINKWQIIDNLRRSLYAVSLFSSIILSLLIENTLNLLSITVVIMLFPLLIRGIDYIKNHYYKTVRHKFNCDIVAGLKLEIYKILVTFLFLPYESYMSLDAIIRSVYRMYISKKKLLEWVTAAETENLSDNDLKEYSIRMKINYLVSIGVLIFISLFRLDILIIGLIIALAWLSGPYIAFKISQEVTDNIKLLTTDEERYLYKVARRTWSYFEICVNKEHNFLPPDNFQKFNGKGLAPRTSPTNVGLYLVSVITARDFGFITVEETISRIEDTLKTYEYLNKWNGHMYNWYDTKSLEVLRPAYVSTVDSGNFISYLIPLKEGLLEILDKPILNEKLFYALEITRELIVNTDSTIKDFDIKGDTFDFSGFIDYIYNYHGYEDLELEFFHKKFSDMIYKLKMEIDNTICISIMDSNSYSLSIREKITFYKQILKESHLNEGLKEEIRGKLNNIENLKDRILNIVSKLEGIIETIDFSHLYNKKRNLFSIGYSLEEEKLTDAYYDLLASEARTTSFLGIAKGQINKKHWSKLGRGITIIDGFRGLVSWSGTMFEYFMPYLLMKNYNNSLMHETYCTTIRGQIDYSSLRGTPWGISESGYYAFDMSFNYQYKAFGIPYLGLKRGLSNEVVVSPYSTFLALPIAPRESMDNLLILKEEGLEGDYGYFEAIDYTPSKAYDKGPHVIYSYMTHHQGMILNSLNNYLNNFPLQRRFHQDAIVKAGEVLLQEKIPLRIIIAKEVKEEILKESMSYSNAKKIIRTYRDVEGAIPQCHILSNGTFSTMVNTHGGGYTRAGDVQITRWREDPLGKKNGQHIFIRHLDSNETWSTSYDLLNNLPDGYEVIFTPDKAEIYRRDGDFGTHMEIYISPEDDVEIRRIKISNHSNEVANIEVTSYFEIVLTSLGADLAHPTFSNLFVRTEVISQLEALIAARRPRAHGENEKWLFHMVKVNSGEEISRGFQFDTSREAFIGRGKELHQGDALKQPLRDSAGIVLDPIMSLRKTIIIQPESTIEVDYLTGVQDSREEVLKLINKYYDAHNRKRIIDLSSTRSQIEQNYLDIDVGDLISYQEMLSNIIYLSGDRNDNFRKVGINRSPQRNIWAYGLSGETPIVLVIIKRIEDMYVIKKMLKAHEYWQMKNVSVDLVIFNMEENNYYQPLGRMIKDIIAGNSQSLIMDQPGGIHLKNIYNIASQDIPLFYSLARIIVNADDGIKIEGQGTKENNYIKKGKYLPYKSQKSIVDTQTNPLDVQFYNGYGGFNKDGTEYIIQLKGEMATPAPWINVVSNEKFGFIISENGAGFTWCENSRENRITPWYNDAVSDQPGEIVYIRDEDDGLFWTLTPSPIRASECYTIHHGLGYTKFSQKCRGISHHMTLFVPREEPLKISIIKLINNTNKKRRFSLFYYVRPVMGVSEYDTQQHNITEEYEDLNLLTVQNPFNNEYNHKIAFISSSEKIISYSGNRLEFIGNRGKISDPQGMQLTMLSNNVGSGYDPSLVIQIIVELDTHEEKEVSMILGEGENIKEINGWVDKFTQPHTYHNELNKVISHWLSITDTVKVETPDMSMDLMLNGWLIYQSLSCRVWARSAFYQSGGAYGFRDQLQDALNLVNISPEITREQIILHSGHQFVEGDVQHWWHPGYDDKGIRTRFSDDLLWLPYSVAKYIKVTGDESILFERIHFLEEEELKEGEDERYGIPRISQEKGSVYEHCIRAIDRSLKVGDKGIPLMGSGDWNDGMSTVGNEGKGQSVWLGWFLYDILGEFIPICDIMEDNNRKINYFSFRNELKESINENAWDGQWYLRGFYDDGSPLGSSKNMECKIDSLGQSWAVISEGGEENKVNMAMASMEEYLINSNDGIVMLFTPPFDNGEQKPGYIKGYVPGVRENGGQYTHAAAWAIKALAMRGEGNKALEVYHLINPVNHTRTQLECATYKLEPYVIAADVYAVNPHVGRGGWSWYTGAAGWMYSIGLEDILGFKKRGNKLYIEPNIPSHWNQFKINYKYGTSSYEILVSQGKDEESKTIVNGLDMDYIPLIDDGNVYQVQVIINVQVDMLVGMN